MNIPSGGWGPHTGPLSYMKCSYTPLIGQKEAEHMFCQGCRGSMYDPDSEADQSTMELVGYCTSQKEIRDIYQSIYLLQRAPGLPSCGDRLRRKPIQDILSSLKSRLHRWRRSTTARDQELQEEGQVRPNQQGSYEEALRVARQRALDTAEALTSNTERLSWRRRDRSLTCSWTHSRSRSHSRARSWSRSCSRAQSQNRSQGSMQNACPRSPDYSPPRRRVTFRNPKVGMSPKRDMGTTPWNPPSWMRCG